jgi:hypothetical protein
MPTSGLSREQVLDELDRLATVEHALCVEYLTIHCALGHDLPPAETASGQRVRDAAEAAFGLALGEMGQLHRINRALTLAGRPPQVDRAASVGDPGSEIALGLKSSAQLERLVALEREIAAAVDARYAPLCAAVASPDPLFEGALLEQITLILDPCPDHSAPLENLRSQLEGVPPGEYLRASRREPSGELERSLLGLSDLYYALIVATVRAWFADEDELGGELRGRALTTMDGLNAIDGLLVARGLLPAFHAPPGGP